MTQQWWNLDNCEKCKGFEVTVSLEVPGMGTGRLERWLVFCHSEEMRNKSSHQVPILFYWLALNSTCSPNHYTLNPLKLNPQPLHTKVKMLAKFSVISWTFFHSSLLKIKNKIKNTQKHSLMARDTVALHHCCFSDKLLSGIYTLLPENEFQATFLVSIQ